MERIVVSTGDPAGVAPELLPPLLEELRRGENLIMVGPPTVRSWLERHGPRTVSGTWEWQDAGEISSSRLLSGRPDARSGAAAFASLEGAVQRLRSDGIRALLTLPLAKGAVREAGRETFTGHTEYLEQQWACRGLMSFFGDTFNVGLLTRHCPLREVVDRLQPDSIERDVRLADRFFRERREAPPRLALLGLNPHAGEGGRIGDEEQTLLRPALRSLNGEGIRVEGPFAADGYFPVHASEVDMVLAPYHDQGLVAFKLLHFFTGVHATLGLPVARAGPDHGVAADLAGTGRVDDRSTRRAFRWLRRHASD